MKVAIIGAGVAGLTAAYDLVKAGHDVEIFEAGEEVGGLAAGFKAANWDWNLEKFYHHWFQSDKAILGLIEELGWSRDVFFPRPVTVIYHEGKWVPFDSPQRILSFLLRTFSPLDALRFGLTAAYLRLTPRWQPLEKVTADAWMRRWCGDRVYEALWKPLLVGKFGEENFSEVNMAWLWARLHSRTTRLGSFRGGFQGFASRFAAVVTGRGAKLSLKTPVTSVKKTHEGLILETAAGGQNFDAVISTSSPSQMARLAPDLPPDYLGSLASLKSMGAVVLVITLDRQLTPYYWHNLPKEAGFPFLALVEHTNFIPAEHYGDDRIIYCGDYLEPDHEYFRLTKEELLDRFLPSFSRFNPDFKREWIKDSWLWRTGYAQPVPPVDHSRNIPSLRTPLRALYFASMSQVYPWDRGTNYAVGLGHDVARMVVEDLR